MQKKKVIFNWSGDKDSSLRFNFGVYLDNRQLPEGFDIYFNYLKNVNGDIGTPIKNSHNIISCFSDNKTAKEHPEWIALSEEGKATRREAKEGFYADWICPTKKNYQKQVLNLIEQTSKADVAGIHLDSLGFPHQGYCVCRDCRENWKNSHLEWSEWRNHINTEFVKSAADKCKDKELSITLYPDPVHPERFGLDPEALSVHVSFFVIPLYDMSYQSAYWFEILLNAFKQRLRKPFYVLLYAYKIKPKNLLKVAELTTHYSRNIIFSYDEELAKKTIDLLKQNNV